MIRMFDNGFDFQPPDTVYVVGSGPSVLDHYPRIPKGAYVVALNGAVNLEGLKSDVWFAHCQRNLEQDWWETSYNNYKGIKIFGSFITERGYDGDYWFDFHKDLSKWRVQTGITVAGIAIQLLLMCGVRNIIVCGLDMAGTTRYDGVENPKNSREKWLGIIKHFNSVLAHVKAKYPTYSIFSLGPTNLDILNL